MRKFVILVASIIVYASISPAQMFAAGSTIEQQKTAPELNSETAGNSTGADKAAGTEAAAANKAGYNDLGIKIGTKVYGEDISKLSKKELQYIPAGWRDGVFEDELQPERQTIRLMSTVNYPDVNNYISSKKLPTANVEYDHKSNFPNFGYRNGVGKPEGVVVHETANSNSTITGEINYMTENYENAFVHAFVDNSRIIEIHSPDYAAWGAGRYANERFIHVELVRTHSFDAFARSINNDANYVASLLAKYNLGVDSAAKDGKGTLWSHNDVSKYLGGTNHSDPIGYFSQWGYTWDDFVSLVSKKYAQLSAARMSGTSRLGQVNNANVRIYDDVGAHASYITAGSTYTGQVFYIKKQAVYKGATYYLLSTKPSSTEGVIGWVSAKDLVTYPNANADKNPKTFYIKSGIAYNRAWGGKKNIVYTDLSRYQLQEFRVNLTEKVGNNIWYRGILNGKTLWLHSSHVWAGKTGSTSRLAHILNGAVKIYPKFGDKSAAITAGTKYTDQVFYIKKQLIVNGSTYYLLSTKPSSTEGVIGWVPAKDLVTYPNANADKNPKTLYIKSGIAYNRAWGGKKNIVYTDLSRYQLQEFQVNLTEKVGNNIWYRGILNGRTLWLHSSHVWAGKTSSTSRLAHILNGAVKIYPKFGDKSAAITAGTKYTDQVFYIKKQLIVNGSTYYLLSTKPSSTEGVIGWVSAKDLVTYPNANADKNPKTLYIKSGIAYNRAWGGKKNIVYTDLSQYQHQKFQVNLTEKVGNNIWYRGILNGRTLWIHEDHLVLS